MAESLKTLLMSALTSKATPAESDTLIVGEGNVLKKISFSQLLSFFKSKTKKYSGNISSVSELIVNIDMFKMNGAVFGNINIASTVNFTSINAWTQKTISTSLPAEFRPAQSANFVMAKDSMCCNVIFDPNGTIAITPHQVFTTQHVAGGSFNYISS